MKKALSFILALVISICPATAFADGIPCGQPLSDRPGVNADLTHIICYGQSFSTGSDAPYYDDPAVENVYVYGSITNSSNGTELKRLTPSAGNQHPVISAGNVLAKLLTDAGIDTDIVLGSYGSGGRTIAQLMSAERQAEIKEEEGYSYDILSSGKYDVFRSSVSALARYARANGKSVSCPAIIYLQGETDQNTDTQLGYPENPARAGYGAGGDKEKYKLYMSRLKEDMQREVTEQYGQTEKPLFFIYQASGTYTRTQYSSINMAQIEFAEENDDVVLLQSPYFTPHYTNSHHLTQNGYRWLGEYIGRSVFAALTENEKPRPMLPQSIEIISCDTVRITVSGAQNGLAVDTFTVEDASNGKNLYGFYLQENGRNVVPAQVAVFGDIIELTLPAALTEKTVYVYYAGKNAAGTGNIRDNCAERGFYEYLDDSGDTGTGNNQGVSHSALDADGNSLIGQKYPLYNWLESFCYEIEVPESARRQGEYYCWETGENGLVCVAEGNAAANGLTLLQGGTENGVLDGARYALEKTVVLEHDRRWAIEWKASSDGNGYAGGKLLVSSGASDSCAQYLYIPADSRGMVAWGVGSDSANYGFQLGKTGIDTREEHIYRIENRVGDDGVNTVFLTVDGTEIGAMTTGYRTSANSSGAAGSVIDEPSNWANGKNIYIDGIGGSGSFALNNMKLSYLKVWEDADTGDIPGGTCGDGLVWSLTSDGTLGITGTGEMSSRDGENSVPWSAYRDRIKKVTIGEGVTSIGAYAFMQCVNLADIRIPESVVSIEGRAFTNCSNLKRVVIPANVADIQDYTFHNCTGLSEVVFTGDALPLKSSVFRGVTATAYYPCDNGTWDDFDMDGYGGSVTWKVKHGFAVSAVVTSPTCTEKGYTTYTCVCGETYTDNYVDASGHSFQHGFCTVCGAYDTATIRAGDMDGNGVLDSEDAYRLLRYVLYPDLYELNAFAPFYGGREPTSDDAVYLLRYILYPEKYPLIQSGT